MNRRDFLSGCSSTWLAGSLLSGNLLKFNIASPAAPEADGTRQSPYFTTPSVTVWATDLAFFKSVGIRKLTSVTCWTNRQHVARFGEPPLKEYGRELLSWAETPSR